MFIKNITKFYSLSPLSKRILLNLSKEFVSNIKRIYVFRNGDYVFIITNDDNIYTFGDNTSGRLCLCDRRRINKPTIISELCQKQVINIKIDCLHTKAYTKNGTVLVCNGSGSACYQTKPKIYNGLIGLSVSEIKSGSDITAALTTTGEVYVSDHRKVLKQLIHEQMISNSVFEHNYVFDALYYLQFSCITLNYNNSRVIKIVCGANHTILLLNDGNVYCFGCNRFGQCGDGSWLPNDCATKVVMTSKFIDIAAIKCCNLSVGLCENGFCYVWGKFGEQYYNIPMITPFTDINDCIEFCSMREKTDVPLVFNKELSGYNVNKLVKPIKCKFNRSILTNVVFKIEGKTIYAKKSRLNKVSEYFEKMFLNNNWVESNSKEIEIKDYSYSVFHAFIKYLYTGNVNINDEEVIELLKLAHYYMEEKLQQICVLLLIKLISRANNKDFYNCAVKYNLPQLRRRCVQFYMNDVNVNYKNILETAINYFSISVL